MTNNIEIDFMIGNLRKAKGIENEKRVSRKAVQLADDIEDLQEDVREMLLETRVPRAKVNQIHSRIYKLKKELDFELAVGE